MNKQLYQANKAAYKKLKVVVARPPAPLNERQSKQVKRMMSVRSELKYHSKTFNNQSFGIGTGFYLVDLTDVAQGQTDTTRIGDKATLSRIEYTYSLIPTLATQTNVVRIMFFQYKPNDAAVLTSIDGIVDNGPSGILDPWSPYDHDFKTDYTILSDKMYTMNPNGEMVKTQKTRYLPIKKARKDLTYVAGATFGGNHIYMAVWSNGLLGTNPVQITGRTRIFYRDA